MTEIKELKYLKDNNLTPNPLWLYCHLKIYTGLNPDFSAFKGAMFGLAGLSETALKDFGFELYKKAYLEKDWKKQLEIAAAVFNDRLKRFCERFNRDWLKPSINDLKFASIGYVTGEGNIFVNGTRTANGDFLKYIALNLNEADPYTWLKSANISPTTGKGFEFANRVEALYKSLDLIVEEKVIKKIEKDKSLSWLYWLIAAIPIGLIPLMSRKSRKSKRNPSKRKFRNLNLMRGQIVTWKEPIYEGHEPPFYVIGHRTLTGQIVRYYTETDRGEVFVIEQTEKGKGDRAFKKFMEDVPYIDRFLYYDHLGHIGAEWWRSAKQLEETLISITQPKQREFRLGR